MHRSSTVRNTLFLAGVLGSLGFGSAQAFAAPRAATDTFCSDVVCAAGCIAKGHWGGYCSLEGSCICYRLEP